MRVDIACCFLLVSITRILTGQTPATEPAKPFLKQIEGTWRLAALNAHGGSTSPESYGLNVFEDGMWLMQTRNGDHVFQLTHVDEEAAPTMITCVERGEKRSFVALARLNGDRLVVARGMKPPRNEKAAQIPPPTSVEPARNTLVYTFLRSTSEPLTRPELTIRLADNSGDRQEVLIDRTITTHFGGGFRYASTGMTRAHREDPSLPGSVVEGSIRENADGEPEIEMTLRIATAIDSDMPNTQVVQSRLFFIRTPLPDNRLAKVKCGHNIWCELSVKMTDLQWRLQ